MNQLTIVFVDEAGTELNRYELEDVATGVKTDVRLLRDAVFTVVGTDLNAANLNPIVDAINDLIQGEHLTEGNLITLTKTATGVTIATTAQANVIESIKMTDETSDLPIVAKKVTIPKATNLKDGAMSSEDKDKLDNVEPNAQKNSNITKEEIEAKLIGRIDTHRHIASIDEPIDLLNNHSLREVFEDSNTISLQSFNYSPNATLSIVDNELHMKVLSLASSSRFEINNYVSSLGDIYYALYEIKNVVDANTQVTNSFIYDGYDDISANEYFKKSFIEEAISSNNSYYRIYVNTLNNQLNDIVKLRNVYLINITSLGIDNLTVEQLDAYYAIYASLKPSYEYIDQQDALKVDKNISSYTEKSAPTGSERLFIDDAGVPKRTLVSDIMKNDYKAQGLGAYKASQLTYHDVTLVSAGDFKVSLKTQDSKQLLFVKFPVVTSESNLRLSTDNGTTFYNVLMNNSTFRANIVSEQLVRMQFDGTRFIADIQSGVEIIETLGESVESTFGLFAPQKDGLPIITEIQGLLLDAPQLVTNGDFSESNTFWELSINTSNEIVTFTDKVNLYSALGNNVYIRRASLLTISSKYYISFDVVIRNGVLGQDGWASTPITTTGFHSLIKTATDTSLVIKRATAVLTDIDLDNINLFNISTLIANKQYSPIFNTTFDLMSDAQIKEQMDAWVSNKTLPSSVVQAVENTQIKSVGKNLLDGTYLNNTYLLNGQLDTSTGPRTTNLIRIKPSTTYTMSGGNRTVVSYRDINNVLISYDASSIETRTITTPSNAHYMYWYYSSDGTHNNIQLEQGTVATTYEPYKSSTQTFTHDALYRLPNGVYDSIEYRNGKYVYVQRVKKYMLQASDITAVLDATTLTWVYVTKRSDDVLINNTTTTLTTSSAYLMANYFPGASANDFATNIYSYHNWSTTQFRIGFPLGTTLAEAKTTLSGTVIYYQLATPIETEIEVDGLLVQDSVTTLYQLQDLATTYKVEFPINTEQTTKVLVERDRLQQNEIDAAQARITANEADILAHDGRIEDTEDRLDVAEPKITTLENSKVTFVTVCPTAIGTAGKFNVYVGATCATKYDNWVYLETE